MRRKLIVGLMAINGLIAGALLTTPAQTQIIPLGIWNCCQTIDFQSLDPYCCEACCWFVWDCRVNEDCEPDPPN